MNQKVEEITVEKENQAQGGENCICEPEILVPNKHKRNKTSRK